MNSTVANILLVLVFILIGGFFAAAEMALVSLRESQVKAMLQDPKRASRAQRVARLHDDPNRFLAAVQVGVTLAALLSAAVGGATLADKLSPVLQRHGVSKGVANLIALVAVTVVISYFSLVLGELSPKRIALQRAEWISLRVAPFLEVVSRFSRPIIWLLSASTNVVVRMLGGDPTAGREEISQQELRDLVATHRTLGKHERDLIDDVFSAGDRQIREVMVPRTEVEFIDASTPVFKAVRLAMARPHSRYPVVRGSHDDVVGFVHVRDLYNPEFSGRSVHVGEIVRDVKLMPATKRVLPALSEMQREGQHLAIVIDEYGGTAGMVTLEDLVEELVGDIRDEYDAVTPQPARGLGGDIEVDGLLNLEDFAEATGVELPEGPYETVAGYVTRVLGHIANPGESVRVGDYGLIVAEVDGRRVSKVRVCYKVPPEPEQDEGQSEPAENTSANAEASS